MNNKTNKKQRLFIGFAVVMITAIFTLAGCDTGGGGGGGGDPLPELSGNVTISGTPLAGETLTADTSGLTGKEGNLHYQWKAGDGVVGTDAATYEAAAADEGKTITVTVSADGNSGSVTSGATAAVIKPLIEVARIAGGSFQMGSPATDTDSYSNERPVRTVTLGAFKLGKYEVTQEEWYEVMKDPANLTATGEGTARPGSSTANPEDASADGWKKLPVERVSWYDILVFCNKLSVKENLTPVYSINGSTDPADWGTVPTSSTTAWDNVTVNSAANGYRLPTEAEWEYAAKGGNNSPGGYTYAGSNTIDDVAWYTTNSSNKMHEVGKKAANGLGLYDMSGNVWEWCWDWYASTYTGLTETDPTGASSGSFRVLRGGSVTLTAQYGRSALRNGDTPSYRGYALGFRVARP